MKRTLARLPRRVLVAGLSQEVAGHQSAHAIDLRHEEPIIIHVPVHVDNLPSLEVQLGLQHAAPLL